MGHSHQRRKVEPEPHAHNQHERKPCPRNQGKHRPANTNQRHRQTWQSNPVSNKRCSHQRGDHHKPANRVGYGININTSVRRRERQGGSLSRVMSEHRPDHYDGGEQR